MKRRKLGCLTTGGLIALIVSLVLIGASYAFTGNRMFSPGQLNAQASGSGLGGVQSHADLDENCAACHPAFWQSTQMTNLCLECHDGLIEQLKDNSSLHGAVMAGFEEINCRDCHTDHNGPEATMTKYLSGDFQHELVGYSLDAHKQIDWEREMVCEDCHQGGFTNFESIVCINCHEQVDAAGMQDHTDLFGFDCLACHDGVDTYGADFDHNDMVFPLRGKHAQVACEQCHVEARTLADLQMTPTACEACHLEDDAHEGVMGERCGVCHSPTDWEDAIFDHSATGFFLVGGHDNLECENCHADATYQGLDPACISCHADDEPHEGQFGQDCAACHVVSSWQEINFDHSGDYARDCASCHTEDAPANHYPGQCSACHSTDAWLPANFDHQVAGATDCVSCHNPDKPANHYSGQCSACHSTDAWLPASFNHQVAGATDCISCHSSDRPTNHFTGQCSQCHSTNAWKPASFAHTFPLNHGGANQRCELCHTNNNYNAYTCYGCHEHNPSNIQNEHEGVSNINNCIRCHWDGRKHEDGGGGDGDDD